LSQKSAIVQKLGHTLAALVGLGLPPVGQRT